MWAILRAKRKEWQILFGEEDQESLHRDSVT